MDALAQCSIDRGYALRLALEPKPNEPRGDILLPSIGYARAFINELQHPACPIRAQYAAQLRSLTANHGQHFPLQISKPPGQSLFGFVFQAGHASSILVTRSTAKGLVNNLMIPRQIA